MFFFLFVFWWNFPRMKNRISAVGKITAHSHSLRMAEYLSWQAFTSLTTTQLWLWPFSQRSIIHQWWIPGRVSFSKRPQSNWQYRIEQWCFVILRWDSLADWMVDNLRFVAWMSTNGRKILLLFVFNRFGGAMNDTRAEHNPTGDNFTRMTLQRQISQIITTSFIVLIKTARQLLSKFKLLVNWSGFEARSQWEHGRHQSIVQ